VESGCEWDCVSRPCDSRRACPIPWRTSAPERDWAWSNLGRDATLAFALASALPDVDEKLTLRLGLALRPVVADPDDEILIPTDDDFVPMPCVNGCCWDSVKGIDGTDDAEDEDEGDGV
jgi:hypothetical protein